MKTLTGSHVNRKVACPGSPRPLRKILRRTAIVALFLALGAAVCVLSLIPALLRAGYFHEAIEAKLSALLGHPLTFDFIDIPRPDVILLKGIRIDDISPDISAIRCDEIRATFDGVVAPFGNLTTVDIAFPSATVDIDAAAIRRLLTSSPGRKGFILDIGALSLPPIKISNGVVGGRFDKERYRIASIDGSLRPGGGKGLYFFELAGEIDGAAGNSAVVAGEAVAIGNDGKITIDRFQLGTIGGSIDIAVTKEGIGDSRIEIDIPGINDNLRKILRDLTEINLTGNAAVTTRVEISEREGGAITFSGSVDNYKVDCGFVALTDAGERTAYFGTLRKGSNGRIAAADIEIDNIRALLPGEYEATAGKLILSALFPGASGDQPVKADLDLLQCAVENKRNGLGVERLNGRIRFDGSLSHDGRVVAGAAKVDAKGFEFHWGTIKEDFAQSAVELAWNGTIDAEQGRIDSRQSALTIPGIGTFAFEGWSRWGEKGGYDFEISTRNLSSETLLKKTQSSFRLLSGLTLQGPIDAMARLTGGGGETRAEGVIHGSDVSLKYGIVDAPKLFFDIPFSLQSGDGRLQPEKRFSQNGFIGCEEAIVGGAVVRGISFGVHADVNTVMLNTTAPVRLFGGELEIGNTVVTDIITHPRMTTSLAAKNIDMIKLGPLLGIHREINGTLTAFFHKIAYTGKELRLDGALDIDVFRGNVRVENILVEKRSEGAPAVSLGEIAIREISLRDLCHSFMEFGLIYGVVEGTIRDLKMIGSDPVSFEMDIYAVPRDGIEQKVNAKMVKKLVILGEGSNALDRLLYITLPNTLYYSRLGLYAILRDEKLYIRGKYYEDLESGEVKAYGADALKRGETFPRVQEYLVVGASYNRINVINLFPGKTIKFSKLIDRIKQAMSAIGD